jgi:hypothetical protein
MEVRDMLLRDEVVDAFGLGEHDYQFDTFEGLHCEMATTHLAHLFEYKCAYCGQSVRDLRGYQLDHAIPRALGGHNVAENLIPACPSCNFSKGKRTVSEFYSYRRLMKRTVVTDLEEIALRLERHYLDTYSEFTKDEVIRIKQPLLEVLPFPPVGASYIYEKDGKLFAEDNDRSSRPEIGSQVTVVQQRSHHWAFKDAYECKVRDAETGHEYWISCLSLRRLGLI